VDEVINLVDLQDIKDRQVRADRTHNAATRV
jgi:hypothetical protein